jgi:hypothetical protein
MNIRASVMGVHLCFAVGVMQLGLTFAQTKPFIRPQPDKGSPASVRAVAGESSARGSPNLSRPKKFTAFHLIDETSQSGSYYSLNEPPRSWVTLATSDWMSFLSDSTQLSKMSIPGTHDSGARVGGIAFEAQAWSISEQLDAGVRYLDIRTRRTHAPGIHALAIHHSYVFQNLRFNDVMDSVVTFLKKHPYETIIMRVVGDEYGAEEGSKTYAEIWRDYAPKYGKYFAAATSSLPTLGALRGKVYVLNDQADFPFGGSNWRNANALVQDNYYVFAFLNDYTNEDSVSLPTKRNLVVQYIDIASDPKNTQWVFNHLSGAGGMAPRDVAGAGAYEGTNYVAYYHAPYSGERSLGTIIMDFPGERLLYRIIKSNFQGQMACQAATFRDQSAHSWAEFRLPTGIETQTIVIPSGAYNNYVFPTCNRVFWSNLTFACNGGTWQRTEGTWDADAGCIGTVPDNPWVAVGDR